jgi:chemotaxis signal transduction protein
LFYKFEIGAPLMSENLLIFSLGGRERYALSITLTREIVKLESLNQVPGSPPQMLGLARVRDLYIPVIDTRAILFGKTAEPKPSMAIILDLAEPFAMAVHEVSQVMKWAKSADSESVSRGRFVDAVIQDDHGIIQKLCPAEIVLAFRGRHNALIEATKNAA